MHSPLCLFVLLALHSLVPIFVRGDVTLLRTHNVLKGSDLNSPVSDLASDEKLIRSVKPLNSEITTIPIRRHRSRLSRFFRKLNPPKPPLPYKSFFIAAKKVEQKKDFEQSIRDLAGKIAKLIPKEVLSPEKFEVHLSRHQDDLIECFKSAKKALEDIKVHGSERFWALGILAGLLEHLPLDASNLISHLKTDLWKNHIYLEIQTALAFEVSLSHKLGSHFQKGRGFYDGNPAMEECFKRAEFLSRQERLMQQDMSLRSHALEEYVSNQFLNVEIPSGKDDIKKTIEIFSTIFKDVEHSILKGEIAINTFNYLTRYWEHTTTTEEIMKLVESDEKIYRDFYSPFARSQLKSIIENEQDLLKIKDLIPEEIKNTNDSPGEKSIEDLIKTLEQHQLMPDVEFEIYKVLMIECTLHSNVNQILIDSIQRNENLAHQIRDIRKRNRSNSMTVGTKHFEFFNYINSDFLLRE
ncbi:hypothetical protein DFH28DRAFT_1191847 [Melampsora americana]|nr:hypothetical protein DFH28DRAFT_1191847 [Melampsora americana]